MLNVKNNKNTNQTHNKYRTKTAVLSAISQIGSKAVTLGIGLVSMPIAAKYLGIEKFGVWATLQSTLALIAVADLGLANGVLSQTPIHKAKNDYLKIRQNVYGSFVITAIIAVTVYIIYIAIGSVIDWSKILNLKSTEHPTESTKAVALGVGLGCLSLPLTVFPRLAMGFQLGYLVEIFNVVSNVLMLAALFVVVQTNGGMGLTVLALSSPIVISSFLIGLYLNLQYKELRPTFSEINISESIANIKLGLWFFGIQIMTVIGNSLDNLIISHHLGAEEVSSYAVTKRLFLYLMITQHIIQPMWPAFGDALARNDMEWVRKAFWRLIIGSTVVSAIIGLAIVYFGKLIIAKWVGGDFIPNQTLLWSLYAWSFLLNYGGIMSVVLNNGDLVKKQFRFIFISAAASILFQHVLVQRFGACGAPIGILIGYTCFYIVPSFREVNQLLSKGVK